MFFQVARVAKFGVVLSAFAALSSLPTFAASAEAVKVGDKAPQFTMQDQDGHDVSLKDYAGKKVVVLYFYPKDNTPICTKEACSFRDQFDVFTDEGAEVLGVSGDSVESHKQFATEHKLPFKLLSDKDNVVRKSYGVPSTMGIKPGRVTYVIDKNDTVRLVFNAQLEAKKHVDEALNVIKDLDKK